jgi:hypothetical protein
VSLFEGVQTRRPPPVPSGHSDVGGRVGISSQWDDAPVSRLINQSALSVGSKCEH